MTTTDDRRGSAAAGGVPVFAAGFPAARESVSVIRRRITSFAAANGGDPHKVRDVALAVTEAAANAVMHAYDAEEAGVITVSANVEGGVLEVVVIDTGRGLGASKRTGAGLGLKMMAGVSDEITISPHEPRGTEVRMRFVWPASVSAVSGRASGDITATDGAERLRVGGIDSDREGGRVRVRLFAPSWRRQTTREVLAAADAERERIAQDLHDGVQQNLTALRVRLSLAADRFGERGEAEAGAVLQDFGDDLDQVIDGLRDVARGIYPAVLTSYGLAAALVSVGVNSGGPVTVQASGLRRCRPDVEIAVYFACLAALDNAAKHAGPVPVSVDLSDTRGALEFAVRDSGAGFDPVETQTGAGIANMRDRIAGVGGTVAVDSAPW